MKDYSDLEGKVVSTTNQPEYSKGIVIGCDYDIGITIAKLEKGKATDINFICLTGPSSPHPMQFRFKTEYKKMFDFIVNQIQTGTCDKKIGSAKATELRGGMPTTDTQSNCSFT